VRTLIGKVGNIHSYLGQNSLGIIPIEASGAEKSSCDGVMLTSVCFCVAREWRIKRGVQRGYPVQNGAFYTFGGLDRTTSAKIGYSCMYLRKLKSIRELAS
jgi:hypothetical protein